MTILRLRPKDVIVNDESKSKAKLAPTERIPMLLDTNAIEPYNVLTWLNDTKFGQPHHVVVDVLVMFTSNVNIAKNIINDESVTATLVHMDNYGVITTIGVL